MNINKEIDLIDAKKGDEKALKSALKALIEKSKK